MKFKVAIIGAGPSGYFMAQALQGLQDAKIAFSIDMIEKLPTPWGLVRSGVAPDHQKIKGVSKVFEKVAAHEDFRFFGNVELGVDILLTELEEIYDVVVIASGSTVGRKLGIPGEDLANSISAADFVSWYNSHPDFNNLKVDLRCREAVVVGAGNVAIDVARILAIDPKELQSTDIAQYALDQLDASTIRQVHIFGRRGAEHASFTTPELRDLLNLEKTNVCIDENEIRAAQDRARGEAEIPRELIANLRTMAAIASAEKKGVERQLSIHFLSTPLEIRGHNKVEEIIFGINEIKDRKIVPTGKTQTVKCGLIISAIGYQCPEILGVTYDDGRIKNIEGRIGQSNTYVVGWAKRGPNGVIGTNKSDSVEVAKLLISNLNPPKKSFDILEILNSKQIAFVSQKAWEQINTTEILAGMQSGKPRVKFSERSKMLEIRET
jgi:ferredoxin--NADP+ reductase